jgi:hypothetical protein
METAMRKLAAVVVSVTWGVLLGGTFACLLPYLLNDWYFHRPLPYWEIAQLAGGLLICAGLFPSYSRLSSSPRPVVLPCQRPRHHGWSSAGSTATFATPYTSGSCTNWR